MFIAKLHLPLAISFLLCAGFSDSSNGDDQLGYVLAPVRTEFQRREVSSSASAVLIINAGRVAPEGADDMLAHCRQSLEADLRKLSGDANELLQIRVMLCEGKQLPKETMTRLKEQLKELATLCGYLKVQISQNGTSARWEQGAGALGSGLMDDAGEEHLIINQTLVAAPLRTRLSKLEAGMADAFIELRHPIDARNLTLSAATKDAIRSAVIGLNLETKSRLHFHISSTKAGAAAVETLFSNRQPPVIPDDAPPVVKQLLAQESAAFEKSPALQLAQELGFQEIGYAHASNGGAPELLIDTTAPSFELESLDGQRIEWSQWRGDKPALLTFWGVACGPCRLEAHHLSRLHQIYGTQIAILAVNAYDETSETVRDYLTREKLSHPVVLGGRQVASSLYKVGAYPTTFWINRQGKVVRYVVGFENGEELERDLVEFLDQEKLVK